MRKIKLELSEEEFIILAELLLQPMLYGGTPYNEKTGLKLMKKMFEIYKTTNRKGLINGYYDSYYKGKFEELENEQD